MTYLVFRCQSGSVIFELVRLALGSGVRAFCWTDGTTLQSNLNGQFNPQGPFDALTSKAVALRGTVLQVLEVTI